MNRHRIASKIKRELKYYKPNIYESKETNSIYITFLYAKIGKIRIADHKGKLCKWNITPDYYNLDKRCYPENKLNKFLKDIKEYIKMNNLPKVKKSYVWRKK